MFLKICSHFFLSFRQVRAQRSLELLCSKDFDPRVDPNDPGNLEDPGNFEDPRVIILKILKILKIVKIVKIRTIRKNYERRKQDHVL